MPGDARGKVGQAVVSDGEVSKGEVGRGEVGQMTVRYVMHLDSSTSFYPVNYVQVLEQILTRIVRTYLTPPWSSHSFTRMNCTSTSVLVFPSQGPRCLVYL